MQVSTEPLGRAALVPSRCPVCGNAELRTDEALDRVLWLLAECPRCEHRFTRPVERVLAEPCAERSPARSSGRGEGTAAAA